MGNNYSSNCCLLFKQQHQQHDNNVSSSNNENQTSSSSSSYLFDNNNEQQSSSTSTSSSSSSSSSSLQSINIDFIEQEDIEQCLLEMEKIFLSVIDTINLPIQLQKLIEISNNDWGWLKIIDSMINIVGIYNNNNENNNQQLIENDHIGPAIIIFLLEDSQLPTRELIKNLLLLLEQKYLGEMIHSEFDKTIIKQRNICIILSFLAEKLAGSLSINLLSIKIIKFLEKIIREKHNYLHVLFALNCLEKFARTNENKILILKHFNDIIKELNEFEKYLQYLTLQSFYYSTTKINLKDLLRYQLGFCSQWLLDNLFLKKGRKLSYKKIDYKNLNVILNINDKTEFLKLSPDGLSARCDTYTFECVRSNYPVSNGIYYYEVILLTNGIMQIGWATKSTIFKNHEGKGVGDDCHSIAFDGCRRVIWHNMINYKHSLPIWNSGDIIGCLIDFNKKRFIFYLNGKKFEIDRKIQQKLNLKFSNEPYYAAASLMSYQQCYFNFGQTPFKYPPKKYKFMDFNSTAIIANKDDYKIIPIHVKLKSYSGYNNRSFSFSSSNIKRNLTTTNNNNNNNLCNICFDKFANVRLKPCDHEGICNDCVKQLEQQCPFCREKFINFEEL